MEWIEDRSLLSVFTVLNTADTGNGSFRQAILDSNAASTLANTIEFDIPGDDAPERSRLQSLLPAITTAVMIDGWSQPGFAGTPLIELSGSQAGGGDGPGNDHRIRTSPFAVWIVDGFSQGDGIHVTGTGATGDWLYGDFVGIDPTGTKAEPNYAGVKIDGGAPLSGPGRARRKPSRLATMETPAPSRLAPSQAGSSQSETKPHTNSHSGNESSGTTPSQAPTRATTKGVSRSELKAGANVLSEFRFPTAPAIVDAALEAPAELILGSENRLVRTESPEIADRTRSPVREQR